MPKDEINYSFTENNVVYDFYDVFVPSELFRQPSLWTWGLNTYGQLGTNDIATRTTPVTTFAGGTNWKSVICIANASSAIKTDGTLWVWGDSSNGRLGTNDDISRSTPVTTFAGGTDWKQTSTNALGQSNMAAIKTDGTLWVWGSAGNGRLGTNDTINRSTPVTTFAGGNDWKQVSIGSNCTAAIKTDGTLWVWGSAGNGRLGTNDDISRSTPVTTFAGGTDWKSVWIGNICMAAIKTDGTLWIWGLNTSGQLGTNDTTQRNTPVTTFAGGNNWKSVSVYTSTTAIKTDGTLWVWGDSSNGRLGTNDTTPDRLTPVTTFAGGTNWKSIITANHVAAIKTDGTLWVWGDATDGVLGTNDTIDRSTPVTTFAGGTNWKQVNINISRTTAIKYDNF